MSRKRPASSNGRRSLSGRWAELVEAVKARAEAREEDPSAPGVELGDFELLGWLGGGGMGVVFHARDRKLDREIALKLWKLPRQSAELAVRHEAHSLAKVSHPNVIAVYETGAIGDDVFMSMEFVDGKDGRDWLESFFPSCDEVLALWIGAGRGLVAAHEAGIVHRDFKPENILLGADRRVRVADFGIARALHEDASQDEGMADFVYGTLSYMAPELLLGRRGDARADQFSFCVSLWEALYGLPPFAGATREELLASMRARELQIGEPVDGIPRRLRNVVLRGLAMRPEDRWPDMGTLLQVLREIRSIPDRRRRRWLIGAVVGGVAVGSSVATVLMLAASTPEHEKKSSPDGITTDRETTLLNGGPAPVDAPDEPDLELVRGVEATLETGQVTRAGELWADAAERTGPAAALEIAHAFIDIALALEYQDPDTSFEAARLASWAAAHAGAKLLPIDPAQADINNLINEHARLTSPAARRIVNFRRLHNAEIHRRCECQGAQNDETCSELVPSIGPRQHACLADLARAHEADETFQAHLECEVASLETRAACIEQLSSPCVTDELAECQSAWLVQTAACPALPKSDSDSIVTCTHR